MPFPVWLTQLRSEESQVCVQKSSSFESKHGFELWELFPFNVPGIMGLKVWACAQSISSYVQWWIGSIPMYRVPRFASVVDWVTVAAFLDCGVSHRKCRHLIYLYELSLTWVGIYSVSIFVWLHCTASQKICLLKHSRTMSLKSGRLLLNLVEHPISRYCSQEVIGTYLCGDTRKSAISRTSLL